MLLVQCRRGMAVLPRVTAILIHHSAMNIWRDCCVVSTVKRGYRGSVCSY